ncbi:RING protein [Geosmithia morbida]|uniref:RING protein n=1 Tax=Geosmithia morbida TaxID=1094350 RepID=A0A9P5D2N6_9HYPO|nr:RING protein [Geosmithia morbida]KAF4120995.1 RING protein [Geosmithia morbida]
MATCKLCRDPLVFQIEDEADKENAGKASAEEVPDDLELPCGCHFHWQCLLDESPAVTISFRCPSCESYLATDESGASGSSSTAASVASVILAKYKNEGGLQPNFDILPAITEEAYLSSHPEARPARAFQIMCSEGDVGGMVELLATIDDANDGDVSAPSVLRYQDPLSNMKTGLHLAIERGQTDVALLLLWLCSTIPDGEFPEDGRQTAQMLGVGRLAVDSNGDIRALKDSNGLTAGDHARQFAGQWVALFEAGLL